MPDSVVTAPAPPPDEKKLFADEFIAEAKPELAPLTVAAFIRTHQAPRTRTEWVAAIARFTTERI